jgi:hypothetical protein
MSLPAKNGIQRVGWMILVQGITRLRWGDSCPRTGAQKQEPVPYSKLDNPQTLNLYSYVQNNPLSNLDDDGHATIELRAADAREAFCLPLLMPTEPPFRFPGTTRPGSICAESSGCQTGLPSSSDWRFASLGSSFTLLLIIRKARREC